MAVLLSLKNNCFQSWSSAAIENLDFKRVPTIHWYQWHTVLKFITKTIRFILSTCFPSGSQNFWHMLREKSPAKTMETESWMNPSGRHLTRAAPPHCCRRGGGGGILCHCPGRGSWTPISGFLLLSLMDPSLACLTLCHFVKISHNHQYTYMVNFLVSFIKAKILLFAWLILIVS